MTVEIANIVGSGDLGVELDLEALEGDLSTPYLSTTRRITTVFTFVSKKVGRSSQSIGREVHHQRLPQ